MVKGGKEDKSQNRNSQKGVDFSVEPELRHSLEAVSEAKKRLSL